MQPWFSLSPTAQVLQDSREHKNINYGRPWNSGTAFHCKYMRWREIPVLNISDAGGLGPWWMKHIVNVLYSYGLRVYNVIHCIIACICSWYSWPTTTGEFSPPTWLFQPVTWSLHMENELWLACNKCPSHSVQPASLSTSFIKYKAITEIYIIPMISACIEQFKLENKLRLLLYLLNLSSTVSTSDGTCWMKLEQQYRRYAEKSKQYSLQVSMNGFNCNCEWTLTFAI